MYSHGEVPRAWLAGTLRWAFCATRSALHPASWLHPSTKIMSSVQIKTLSFALCWGFTQLSGIQGDLSKDFEHAWMGQS